VAAVNARRSWSWVSAASAWREPGGVPWASGSASWRAAPRRLRVAARPTAWRMAGASAVKRRAAPSQLEATRNTASLMAGADGAKRRAASSPLEATQAPARRMEAAGGASTWAAPRQLLVAARPTARRTVGAGGVRRRAALSPSLECQAVCSARCVCGVHSRSPTARRHSNLRCAPASLSPRVSYV
jgi:hypothetical protein